MEEGGQREEGGSGLWACFSLGHSLVSFSVSLLLGGWSQQ